MDNTGAAVTAQKGIAVVGSGYVGTVMAACLSNLGHTVVGVEIDPDKVASLNKGIPPLLETGREEQREARVATGQRLFTDE